MYFQIFFFFLFNIFSFFIFNFFILLEFWCLPQIILNCAISWERLLVGIRLLIACTFKIIYFSSWYLILFLLVYSCYSLSGTCYQNYEYTYFAYIGNFYFGFSIYFIRTFQLIIINNNNFDRLEIFIQILYLV